MGAIENVDCIVERTACPLAQKITSAVASGKFVEFQDSGILYHINSFIGGHNVRHADCPNSQSEKLIYGRRFLSQVTGLLPFFDENREHEFLIETHGFGVLWVCRSKKMLSTHKKI